LVGDKRDEETRGEGRIGVQNTKKRRLAGKISRAEVSNWLGAWGSPQPFELCRGSDQAEKGGSAVPWGDNYKKKKKN